MIAFDLDQCTGCQMCMDICLQDAISMQDDEPQLDAQKCDGCELCVQECPAGAITAGSPDTGPET